MSVDKMSSERRIPLVLVSGFLGSGKTTFLNHLFDSFPELKFGVIVNDFGELGIDAAELNTADGTVVHELNNGQIFCSCLAGSFIKSVSAYADLDIDYLLVETSGLAKPSPLLEIIEAIRKMSGERFSYHGMISLVDSGTYLKLSEVLKAVNEQIAYSDIVVLNKVDTADAGTVKRAEMKILSVNPDAEIIRTEFGRIEREVFLGLEKKEQIPGLDRRYSGWGDAGRPVPVLLKSESPVKMAALEDFVNNPGGDFLRMKGRLNTDAGFVFVDFTVAGGKINKNISKSSAEEGLVIILPADDSIVAAVKQRALEIFTLVA
ncbi:MAG TPA: hypothetical protein DCO79_12785 [Spirochaeta sp.]|nr:hypothetical protein [Spirochaeta sp.]